jgi:hypothetical protein
MAKGSNTWIWWTIGGLAVVGLGVGIFLFVKDRKAKKEAEKTLDVPRPTETQTNPSAKPPNVSAQKDDSDFPKWSKEQGDAFRGWVNDTYPAYAKQIDLDRKGSADNSFIRKAWAKYGAEYKKGTTFSLADNISEMQSDVNLDYFMHEGKMNYVDINDANL